MVREEMESIKKLFECQRCGACCHNLVRSFPMWSSELGIPLFDAEVALFDPDLVVPCMVHGHLNGREFIKDVDLLSQLSVSNCPHFTEAGCAIYSKRPDICRAWPVTVDSSSFMLSGKLETQMKTDICPSAANALPTRSMRMAAKKFAQNWGRLSSKILASRRSVYIIDINHRVRYKLTKWLDVPLED